MSNNVDSLRNHSFHMEQAQVAEFAKQPEQAIEHYRAAIEITETISALDSLGDLYRAMDRHREALQVYHRIIELQPGDSEIWNRIGRCHFKLEEDQLAIHAHKVALEIDPENHTAVLNLCFINNKLQDYDTVIELAESVLPHDEDEDGCIFLNYSIAFFKKERYAEAIRYLKIIEDSSSHYLVATLLLGVCSIKIGLRDEALHYYQTAKAINPNDPRLSFLRSLLFPEED